MNRKQNQRGRREGGFTLLETMIAMVVLSFGVLSLATVYSQGLALSNTNQIQFIAQQKAQQALESIFTARNTGYLSWAQINNVSSQGVFLDGAQPLLAPGVDGITGTADDDTATPDGVVTGPGADKILGTSDDVQMNLNPWMTRTIVITTDPNIPNLKNVVITVNYVFQGKAGSFQLVTAISAYS